MLYIVRVLQPVKHLMAIGSAVILPLSGHKSSPKYSQKFDITWILSIGETLSNICNIYLKIKK